MQIISDLHLHSKYSRAVSPQMEIPKMFEWEIKKGIGLLATGDWTHPLWIRELKKNLDEDGSGILRLKEDIKKNIILPKSYNEPKFLLSTEVSLIYSQGGKGRRVHLLVWVPDFETAERTIQELLKRKMNLASDGRPIMGMSSRDFTEIVLNINPKSLIIPAHIWTPWFAVFGSMSGFDSLKECFLDMEPYIYGIETGLSCYDKETQVLTNNGWKEFIKINYSDKLCTLNLSTEQIEYQNPTKIHHYPYKGKMYKLKTKRADLFVTPNHNLVYSHCDFRKKPMLKLNEAKFLFNKSKRLKKDGKWVGENPTYFTLPAVQIKHGSRFYSGHRFKKEKQISIKAWLKFFGFWTAEGWTTEGKNGDYNICVSNNNKLLLQEMKEIFNSWGYQAICLKNVIRVRDYQLFHYLKQFGKCYEKHIPQDIKQLSKENLKILLDYYIKGDGHIYGRNGKGLSATTTSIQLRDDLQEIALKIGFSAYYKLHNPKGHLMISPNNKKIYKQNNDSWVVFFIRHNLHTIMPSLIKKGGSEEKWVDFKGEVYCATVPNHTLYIRRNGIPLWCGNSDPVMNWRIKELDSRAILSFSDAHSGPKLGREATTFNMESLSFDALRKAIVAPDAKNNVAYTIEFYPEEGKYHYTGHRLCNVSQSPEDSRKNGVICPVCHRPLTVGVMHRVENLTGRTEKDLLLENWQLDKFSEVKGTKSKLLNKPPYVKIVPLQEIVSEMMKFPVASLKTQNIYETLVAKFNGEFNVLLHTKIRDIEKESNSLVATGILKMRKGDIEVVPGFDGNFGIVKIEAENKGKPVSTSPPPTQIGLF